MSYVDENGNGVWDEGEPLLVRAMRARDIGGGGGGWVSVYSRPGSYSGPDPHGDGDGGGSGGGIVGDPNDPSSDAASIDIIVKIDRPLTGLEQQALDALVEKILTIDANIKNLTDTEKVRWLDGREVTGAEAKREWARTDFVINEVRTPYDNGTKQGEAAYNNGNPQISFNVDLVQRYFEWYGDEGMNYLVLHDFSHLMQINRDHDVNPANSDKSVERMANDIARAFAHEFDLVFMSAPKHGFSTVSPLVFEDPSDGDGGGGGWGDWEPPMPESRLQLVYEF